MKLQIADISKRANEYAIIHKAQRKEIIDDLRQLFTLYPALAEKVDSFDSTFMRKLQWYPGDITFVRANKVMNKLLGV